ncbi:MAG: cupin domain-containing protein [Spirochaetota bacterium]
MKVKVEKIDDDKLKKMNVTSWPVWEKEASEFDWHYDSTEEFYVIEGDVEVALENGETVSFSKGDFVTFPEGISCTWKVKKPIRKHYNFK